MTNAEKTRKLLGTINRAGANMILDNIANHYGITRLDAFEEVTDEDAESLMDYMTGNERDTAALLMKTLVEEACDDVKA